MALTVADGQAFVLANSPDLVTETIVTVTGDGASLTVSGGTPHGGPSGATPRDIDVRFITDSTTGGEAPTVFFTGVDTANDEIDWTLNCTGAIANNETIQFKIRCIFGDQGPMDGSSITVS